MLNSITTQNSQHTWKEAAIKTVSQDGLCIKSEPAWQKDIDIVREAVKQNSFALFYAPQFQSNREIARLAVEGNGHSIALISFDLQEDGEIRSVAQKNLPERRDRSSEKGGDHRIFFPATYLFFNQIENVYNKFTGLTYADTRLSPFLRDSRVLLFDGTHLIPNSMLEENESFLLRLLPPSGDHFLKGIAKEGGTFFPCIGHGHEPKNREYAIASTYLYDLPFKLGRSCIEGGNCLLFSYNGKRYAIIGELSLLMSFIALEENSLLDDVTPDSTCEPSEHAYRAARNSALFLENKEEPEGPQFYLSFLNPLSTEEKKAHKEAALLLDAKFKRTKEYIAEDLELPEANLIFIPQLKFHIDMEMFVTPEGEVLLHDDQLVLECLKQIEGESEKRPLNEEQQKLLEEFRETAQENLEKFKKEYQSEQLKILHNSGCKVHLLPAIFEARESRIALNYCNGIFARKGKRDFYTEKDRVFFGVKKEKGHVFITTGPSSPREQVFHQKFIDYYRLSFPHQDIQALPGVSQCVGQNNGGIHCLTFEASLIKPQKLNH
jgi:hypothetical protein